MPPSVSFAALPASQRAKAANALMAVVHTAEDLAHHSKSARYNVRGLPEQATVDKVCELTETQAHAIVDVLVARLQVLGQPVRYTLAAVQAGSALVPFPADLEDPVQILQRLGESWTALGEVMGEQAAALRELGDAVSAHMVEHAWMALECDSSRLQEIVGASDPEEAVEHVALAD